MFWKCQHFDGLNWIRFHSLCYALAFCFDHTISWHIYHQLFNSSRNGPTLIGAMRNKSKQEARLVLNRAQKAPKTTKVFSFCTVSIHLSFCNIFPVLPSSRFVAVKKKLCFLGFLFIYLLIFCTATLWGICATLLVYSNLI